VARCLLKTIIPHFGIHASTGSDKGLAFVAEVVQLLAKGLKINWKLHVTYCPQCSGKVECIKRTLTLQLEKLCQEAHLQWNQLLPIPLLRIRSSPNKWTGLSLFKILFWVPTPFSQGPARGP
jgi:hypothetical protein